MFHKFPLFYMFLGLRDPTSRSAGRGSWKGGPRPGAARVVHLFTAGRKGPAMARLALAGGGGCSGVDEGLGASNMVALTALMPIDVEHFEYVVRLHSKLIRYSCLRLVRKIPIDSPFGEMLGHDRTICKLWWILPTAMTYGDHPREQVAPARTQGQPSKVSLGRLCWRLPLTDRTLQPQHFGSGWQTLSKLRWHMLRLSD